MAGLVDSLDSAHDLLLFLHLLLASGVNGRGSNMEGMRGPVFDCVPVLVDCVLILWTARLNK